METFLFYLFKSTLCLATLYFVFRLCFRNDTLFRTNRLLLLGGTLCCHLLPFIQFNVQQISLWQKPVTVVETLLTRKASVTAFQSGHTDEGVETEQAFDRTDLSASPSVAVDTFSIKNLLTMIYVSGTVVVLVFFLLPMLRMCQLFYRYPSEKYEGYRLIVCPLKKGSFTWGRTIVLSQEDYDKNRETVLLHEWMHLHYCHTADLLWMQAIIVLLNINFCS